MKHGVGLTGAAQRRGGKALQLVIAQLQSWMLAGDEQSRRLAKGSERMRNRT